MLRRPKHSKIEVVAPKEEEERRRRPSSSYKVYGLYLSETHTYISYINK